MWLLAELTYRCPLHCVYCSNPVDYMAHREELSTREWIEVLEQARSDEGDLVVGQDDRYTVGRRRSA